jgi:1-acyl-sn-glycerol-3-phosphate acyltransferase
MRTILFYVANVVLTLVLGTWVAVAVLFRVKPAPNGYMERVPRNYSRALIRASGARIVVHNAHLINANEAHVYVANHVSWFDVFVLAAILPRFRFVAKKELARIPVFGQAAKAVAAIFIDRQNRKAAFEGYKGAASQMKGGVSVVVFPEGTRGYNYSLRPFKKGPFVLAIAAQAPVVPTVVHGTREIQRKGEIVVHAGVAEITILDPIPTAGMCYDDRDQLMRTTWVRMAAVLEDKYGVKSGTETSLVPQLTSDQAAE